ncbi:unnamed protein product [Rhizophagus irregularis]|nr:unnamed protein product [Rhizophagus irregularis]
MKQTYFREQKYSRNFLVSKPRNLYEQYVNAFAFSEMTPIQPFPFNFSRKKTIVEHSISPPTSPNPPNIPNDTQFSINAVAQKRSDAIINQAKTELYEYNNLLRTATSSALRTQFSSKIKKLEGTIMVEESKIKSLKGNAAAQNRARERKRQKLDKENIVEIYDAPGHPSYLINNPDLLEKMHSSIEFGAADPK